MSFDFGGDPYSRTSVPTQIAQPKVVSRPATTTADLYSYLPREDQLALTGTATTSAGNTYSLPVAPTRPGTADLLASGLGGASYLGGGGGYVPTTTAPAAPAPASATSAASTAPASTSSNTSTASSTGTQTNATDQTAQAAGSLDLGGLTAQELSAMLDYISAQTGLTVEQLAQQAGALGDAARQMMDAIQRQYGLDIGSTEADALRRGIFHSGILARNVGRVGEARGLQEGRVRSEAAGKLSELQLALDSLVAQNQLSAAQAGSDILQSNLDVGQQAALQNRLAELNLGAIPNLDLGQIANRAAGYSLV